MKVLVTGGAGFIGSHVVDELVEVGHEVVSFDCLSPDAHAPGDVPTYLNEKAHHVFADIRDTDTFEGCLDGVDAVCHQAGKVGLGVDFGDVGGYVSNNDAGTASMLQTLWKQKFAGRFVLASSMVVYGEGRYECDAHGTVRPGPRSKLALDSGQFDPQCPVCGDALSWSKIDESSPLDPRNVYAATKLHQEHLVFAYARETQVTAVALRYHNVYGPRMPRNTPYAGVASLFRSALEAGVAPSVFEDGGQMRDFVHVRDVAHANVLALESNAPEGVFNVCSGVPASIGDVAMALSRHGGDATLTPRVTAEYRLGDVRHIVANADRARDELGYTAVIGLDEGMAEFATAELRRSL